MKIWIIGKKTLLVRQMKLELKLKLKNNEPLTSGHDGRVPIVTPPHTTKPLATIFRLKLRKRI